MNPTTTGKTTDHVWTSLNRSLDEKGGGWVGQKSPKKPVSERVKWDISRKKRINNIGLLSILLVLKIFKNI